MLVHSFMTPILITIYYGNINFEFKFNFIPEEFEIHNIRNVNKKCIINVYNTDVNIIRLSRQSHIFVT